MHSTSRSMHTMLLLVSVPGLRYPDARVTNKKIMRETNNDDESMQIIYILKLEVLV